MTARKLPDSWPDNVEEIGVIVVDHGSRRQESNDRLHDVVSLFEQNTAYKIVEAAHMELARPSIADAYQRCVKRGAKAILVSPFFLLPGRHWTQDIPSLAATAAAEFPDTSFLVAAPLGIHELLINVMNQRIDDCLAFQSGQRDHCDLCDDSNTCRINGQ